MQGPAAAASAAATSPWSDQLGPNLGDHISLVFFLAFLLFSWTTGSIMSGALIERVRLSAYLLLTVLLGSAVWIMDAAWGWSSGGWLVTKYGFHDAIASLVVHGVAGAFALGVLLNLGPRIGKYDSEGRARSFRPHNTHMTLMGLMLIFTGFYGFYAACLVIQSTIFPGWLNIYLSPDDARHDRDGDHVRLRRRLHRRLVREQGRSVLDAVGRPRRRDQRLGRRRRLPPVARLPPRRRPAALVAVWAGGYIEKKLRVDDAVGAVAVHGVCGFYGVFLVGIFAGGFPTGVNNIPSSFGGQLMGMLAFFPLAFLPGYLASWVLKKLEPPARAAGGRARGPRHGRVPAGLLPRVRAAARGDRPADRRGGRGRARSCSTTTSR